MMQATTSQGETAQDKAEQFDRFARHYDGDYRDFYDDVELILDLVTDAGDPVLELGCGTGRVMQHLVESGYAVTGVDISPQLLAVARAKLEQIPNAVYDLVQDDLTSFDLPNKSFRMAVCTSNTLMHLTSPEEQLAALHNAYRHLATGGLLFLDLFNPDVARLLAVNNVVELADEWDDNVLGAHVLKWSVRTVDFAEQLQDTLFVYEEVAQDGSVRKTVCPFLLRFLWRNELELMLHRCGFTVELVWGDYDGEPYGADSERLILAARKP